MSRVRFTFNGRPVEAEEGQSVAGALHAAGITQLTRSMKYRRPRGLYCATGACPNCLLRVDGSSYTRSCITEVKEGMEVEDQMPRRLRRVDPMRAIDFVDFPFPLGFQYRYFKRGGRLFKLWEAQLRRIAGHAAMPRRTGELGTGRKASTDLLVVGAGPAGIGAASAAAAAGLRVALVSRWWGTSRSASLARRVVDAPEPLRRAAQELASLETLEILAPASAFAVFDQVVMVDHGGNLVEISAPQVVLATGAYERALMFEGNDLPGVMLASGALKLLQRDQIRPGRTAVVGTCTDDAYDVAIALHGAGVTVAGVYDERQQGPVGASARLRELGVPIASGARVSRAHGLGALRGVSVEVGGASRKVPCDLLAISGGWQAADELYYQATSHGNVLVEGSRAAPVSWAEVDPQLSTPLRSAGAVTGVRRTDRAFLEGRLAGLHAACASGLGVEPEFRESLSALEGVGEEDR